MRDEAILIFLDEFPSASSARYGHAILLRDVLRAIGIHPILMSTHTGAPNAIRSRYRSSGTDEDPKWCHLITRLPKFHTELRTEELTPYFCASERPLVAFYMIEMGSESDIGEMVCYVQRKLQIKKKVAWTKSSIFQLCQLFRSSDDEKSADSSLHPLVGEHFVSL